MPKAKKSKLPKSEFAAPKSRPGPSGYYRAVLHHAVVVAGRLRAKSHYASIVDDLDRKRDWALRMIEQVDPEEGEF